MQTVPLTRELVLVGGGHAHALVLRRWGMRPLPGARLTLIDPGPVTAYSGMLPGVVAGHYARSAMEIDLVRLARFAGARLIRDVATGIDRARRRVLTASGRAVAYDVLSLDIGITSALPDLPGFAALGAAAKPLGPFAARWEAFLASGAPAEVAVIGAGLGGVELALAMAHRLRERAPRIALVDAGPALADLAPPARARLRAALAAAGIALHENTPVAAIEAGAVRLASGVLLPAALAVAAAGARAWPWLAETGLAATDGFIDVSATLATSDPAIFAAGDCAHLAFAPRPKAGVFAVRAAPVLAANLRAALAGGRMRRYRPQTDYLKLVSLGRRDALATNWGRAAQGPLLWRWKDRIDRRFMARLADLRPMAPPPPRAAALGAAPDRPLCGGCGAKVGAGTLARALAAAPQPARADVTPLPGDDAALLTLGGRRQVLTTDHLRAFTDDPFLLARITALHALGDVWAMGAVPQAALASLVLPRMSEPMQEAWLAEIMAGLTSALAPEGAAIVGGHTTMGAELTIGVTLTGLAEAPVTRAGARPGDALLLTRPLGSGTVLAAEMALAAPGRVVAACLDMMARAQGDAARLLGAAHAMTDVTGFGLAGHLLGICEASGTAAEIDLAAVPLCEGALALARAGHRSTLFPANRAAAGQVTGPAGPAFDLLFDPQTAGGLLAALPAAGAAAALARIRALGHDAALIGRIVEGAPAVRVL